MGSHARGLPCENDSAILRWGREVCPDDGRGVAHDLRAFDEVLDRLLRSQLRQDGESVRGDQVHVGELRVRC